MIHSSKGQLVSVDAYMNSLINSYQEVNLESNKDRKRPVEVSTPTSILSTKYNVTYLDSIFIKGTS